MKNARVSVVYYSLYGTRQPSENELNAARFQGRHVAGTARKLTGGAAMW